MKQLFTCFLVLITLPAIAQLPLRARKPVSTQGGKANAPQAGSIQASGPAGVLAPQLTPIAPNAAAMARYGDVQVNSNAGQISPSVPLYEIKLNDYTLPISLNYASNGLKMNDVAGWVGLGWSINAMGTISRQVRSIPDEQEHGYNGGNPTGQAIRGLIREAYPGYLGVPEEDFKVNLAQYRYDSEPDMFYYNFGSYGGSFFFDDRQNGFSTTKTATTIPKNDLNIAATFDPNTAVIYNATNKHGSITKFSVRDALGVSYEFDISDGPLWPALDDEINYGINRYNTWYLRKITTPNGNTIEFVYGYRKITHPAVFAQKAEIPLTVIPTVPLNASVTDLDRNQSQVIDYYLQQIKVNDGKDGTVRFIEQSTGRSDWAFANPDPNGNQAPRALDRISIENGVGTVIKEYAFSYVSSANRLLLESVTERNGAESLPPHSFSYFNASDIPAYYSFSNQSFREDYWGFFNSCPTDCDKLIPTFTYQPQSSPFVVGITGENKQPNLISAQTGQLASVQYPTKGVTYFTYELNDYQDYTSNPNICTGPYAEVGRATALMSNYSASYGGVLNEVFIPIPQNTPSEQMCIEITYSISIGGSNSQDEVVGAVTLYDASNVAVGQPIILVAKRGQAASQSQTVVVRGTGTSSAGLRAVAELYAEYYTSAINTNKAEIIVRLNSTTPAGGVLRTAGGLRIKGVKACPITSDKGCTQKEYQYVRDDGKSSGQLITPIQHTYFVNKVFKVENIGDAGGQNTYVIQHQGVSSSSQLAIANSGGNHIYYDQVTIKDGGYNEANSLVYNGSTTQKYILLNEAPDFHFEASAPITLYSPVVSQDWKRGKPMSTDIKTQSGAVLKRDASTYAVKNAYEVPLIALKTGIDTYGRTNLDQYILTPYGLTTGFHYQATDISTDYFYDPAYSAGSQTEVTQTSTFNYASPYHYFLTNSTTQNSKNESIESRLFYPADLRTDGDLGPSATNALGSGRKSPVLKQELWTANQLTTTKKTYMNSAGLPSKTIQLYGSATDGSFTDYTAYDTKGNLAEYAVNNGMHVALLWAYNGAYPIAKVANATRPQLASVLGNLDALVATTDNTVISNYGNAIRLGLTNALVTSFTYKYGFGVETETTPDNLQTQYEYDPLGRLATIKNNKSQIVKEYTYNYRDPNASTGSGNDGNQPPSPTGTISDQLATLNQAYTYTVSGSLFSDPENQSLTYTVNGLPAGLSYANNLISGTPTAPGLSLITLTVTDPGGLSSSISFFLTVGSCLVADPYIVKGTFTASTPVSFNAVNRIETDAVQQVLVNPGASLTLKAGQSVRLKPGFMIKPGAAFRAYTGPCN